MAKKSEGSNRRKSQGHKNLASLRNFVRDLEKNDPEKFDAICRLLIGNEYDSAASRTLRRYYEVEPITLSDWQETHPQNISCGSDRFYVSLVNELQEHFVSLPLAPGLPDHTLRETAMLIAAYLEDLVSGTGVWDNIRRMYKDVYGTFLPFYDTAHDEYYEDDINIEDIKLLIWQGFCRCGQAEHRIFSPLSEMIDRIAVVAYDILVDNFNEAPQALRVKNYITTAFRKNDLYQVRELGFWLSARNKITALPFLPDYFRNQAAEISADRPDMFTTDIAYYHVTTGYSFLPAISMLGCSTISMLGSLARAGKFDKTADIISGIIELPLGTYQVKGRNGDVLILSDRLGTEVRVTKSSLQAGTIPPDARGAIIRLVRFGDVWYQSGSASFVQEEIPSDMCSIVFTHDEVITKIEEVIRRNRGRRVYYCADLQQVSDIVRELIPTKPDSEETSEEEPKDFLLMLSDMQIPVLLPDECWIFKDRTNPFYDPSTDRELLSNESLNFIASGRIPDDVAAYIQDKKLLPAASMFASQGKRVGRSIVQNNLRFLAGFYRSRIPN